MVLFHITVGPNDEFLVETALSASNDELTRSVVAVSNVRMRIAATLREVSACAQSGLGAHGLASATKVDPGMSSRGE
jgi:hypothetical protein